MVQLVHNNEVSIGGMVHVHMAKFVALVKYKNMYFTDVHGNATQYMFVPCNNIINFNEIHTSKLSAVRTSAQWLVCQSKYKQTHRANLHQFSNFTVLILFTGVSTDQCLFFVV